jgi:hypothetical protein
MTRTTFFRLVESRDNLDRQVHAAMEETFHVGDTIQWTSGKYVQSGRIEVVTPWERLKVRNDRTRQTSLIRLSRVVQP